MRRDMRLTFTGRRPELKEPRASHHCPRPVVRAEWCSRVAPGVPVAAGLAKAIKSRQGNLRGEQANSAAATHYTRRTTSAGGQARGCFRSNINLAAASAMARPSARNDSYQAATIVGALLTVSSVRIIKVDEPKFESSQIDQHRPAPT
jgi:hypothetical protein